MPLTPQKSRRPKRVIEPDFPDIPNDLKDGKQVKEWYFDFKTTILSKLDRLKESVPEASDPVPGEPGKDGEKGDTGKRGLRGEQGPPGESVTGQDTHKHIGFKPLPAGEVDGTVTGLNLSFVPQFVELQIVKPSGADHIFATPIRDTITEDGFTYELTAVPGENYILTFKCES